jgi:hypothetical protein
VDGSASLDGTLTVSTPGFLPLARDRFGIIHSASISGQFAMVNGTDLANLLVLDRQVSATEYALQALPELTMADVNVVEGDSGTAQAVITAILSTSVPFDINVDFGTQDGLAKAGSDYISVQGTLVIAADETMGTIVVEVLGDPGLERKETFRVNLSNQVDVSLGDLQSTVTILNDDLQPSIAIDDVTVAEPNRGISQVQFTVSLSAPAPSPVQIDFASQDGTAVAGEDYTAVNGTLNWNAAPSNGLVSDGSDGAFTPVSNTTLVLPPDGIFHFTTVHIPMGVTVTFVPNAANTPAILLAEGDVHIAGQMVVSATGRIGGPGGGAGGLAGIGIVDGTDGTGLAPGTGGGAMTDFVGSSGGGGGFATAGLGPANRPGPLPGSPGPAVALADDIYQRGGSGGGGGSGWHKFVDLPGSHGGGGGGGIFISSSFGAIEIDGAIRANGANGDTAFANAFGWGGSGGGGSGGAIDLQADRILVNSSGILQAIGGEGGGISTIQPGNPSFSSGAHGGLGYIRLTGDQITIAGTLEGVPIVESFDVQKTIVVNVRADRVHEDTEYFSIQLTGAAGGIVVVGVGTATILPPIWKYIPFTIGRPGAGYTGTSEPPSSETDIIDLQRWSRELYFARTWF